MDFRGREVDFQGADRRYEELKCQRDGGSISEQEFDEQLKRLMVQDESGRWWVKSRKGGQWHYHDGKSWVRSTLPGYSQPTGATGDQNGGEQHRKGIGPIVVQALVVGVVTFGVAVGAAIYLNISNFALGGNLNLEGKTLSDAAQLVGGLRDSSFACGI